MRYELADRKLARALRDLLELLLVVDPAMSQPPMRGAADGSRVFGSDTDATTIPMLEC